MSQISIILAVLDAAILFCAIYWLIRFSISAVKYQNSTGIFLVTLATVLASKSLYAFTRDVLQIFDTYTEMQLVIAILGIPERMVTFVLIIGLFYLAGHNDEI